jgi:hypothetical protein
MLRMTPRRIVIVALLGLVIGGVLFWEYGPWLSQGGALKMATASAQKYASLNGLDFDQYERSQLEQPVASQQTGVRLYGFVWKPKGGGPGPFIVVEIDAKTTDVIVSESLVMQ